MTESSRARLIALIRHHDMEGIPFPLRDPALYDKRGIPIAVGDILKVYHFTAALRRKRHYMYKQVYDIFENKHGDKYLKICHLNFVQDGYMERLNGTVRQDIEIVQSIKCDHEDRPKYDRQFSAPRERKDEGNG